MLTVAFQLGSHGRTATLGDVPWCAWLRVLGVGHIGCGLGVGADGEEGDEGGMDEDGEERVEDVTYVHDALAEEDEEGDDRDDDVEVCDAFL